jgi:hypothetical protein
MSRNRDAVELSSDETTMQHRSVRLGTVFAYCHLRHKGNVVSLDRNVWRDQGVSRDRDSRRRSVGIADIQHNALLSIYDLLDAVFRIPAPGRLIALGGGRGRTQGTTQSRLGVPFSSRR